MATKMIVEVNKQQLAQASLQQIFEYPTLKQFLQIIDQHSDPCDHTREVQHDVREVQQIWQQLLDQEIQPDTDFFQSGGDSPMATKLVVQLQKVGFETVTLQHIFEHCFANFVNKCLS